MCKRSVRKLCAAARHLQAIAESRVGNDVLGPCRIWLDLVAQVLDKDAKGMHSLTCVEPPEGADQFGAWNSPVQMRRQLFQQAALRWGQVNFLIARLDPVCVQVNCDLA
jgi:hypothetical protein